MSNLSETHEEVISTFINLMINHRRTLGDYIANNEIWDTLSKSEKSFLEETAISAQKFLDQERINNNGNMG